MSATAPVEIGTRGTVASLVMREIEYFRGLEMEHHGSSKKPEEQHKMNMPSSRSTSAWPSFSFLVMTWRRKKKRRRGSRFLPRMCSVVEVSESHEFNGIPGFNYRNLKADLKKYEL